MWEVRLEKFRKVCSFPLPNVLCECHTPIDFISPGQHSFNWICSFSVSLFIKPNPKTFPQKAFPIKAIVISFKLAFFPHSTLASIPDALTIANFIPLASLPLFRYSLGFYKSSVCSALILFEHLVNSMLITSESPFPCDSIITSIQMTYTSPSSPY